MFNRIKEFLKQVGKTKANPPGGLLPAPVKISDFVTHYGIHVPDPSLSDLSKPRAWFHNPIKKSVKQAILEFINAHPVGSQFTANELRRYVNVYATPAPGSTDRILRSLRNKAVIGYILVNRQKSLYEVTPPRVSVPDATGDSQTEPYYNTQAAEVAAEEAEWTEVELAELDEHQYGAWADDGGPVYDEENDEQ